MTPATHQIPWREAVAQTLANLPGSGLQADLVLAVMMKESSGDPWSLRWEP